MIGTMNCIYETSCGWCSKWDKKCDKKTPERGLRAKCNLIDDIMDDSLKEVLLNKMCVEEVIKQCDAIVNRIRWEEKE